MRRAVPLASINAPLLLTIGFAATLVGAIKGVDAQTVAPLDVAGAADTEEALVDVFVSGREGYSCYRIPVLLRLPNGNIALYAEGRKLNCNDQGGIVDVVFKVSADGGATWSALRKLYGESSEDNRTRVTIGNPSPVVTGGRVLMLMVRNAQRVLAMRSLDAAGLQWPSTPTDITDATFANASGHIRCFAGALSPGNDLHRANVTVAAAVAWCAADTACVGFTARVNSTAVCDNGGGGGGGGGGVLDVFFKSRGGTNSDTSWTTWLKPSAPAHLLTGPPAGISLPSGRLVIPYYSMGPTYAGTLVSDDGGATFWPSRTSVASGGEGTVAVAPNTSLILNTRATRNLRFQAHSDDAGATWSAPRVLEGFGSNAEGAMLRVNGSDLLLFSHPNDVNGTANRWNLTVWASWDSAATWTAATQAEPDANVTLHTAYSALVQLDGVSALVVWERGPMGGRCSTSYPHCYPLAGEYQTLRARRVPLPRRASAATP